MIKILSILGIILFIKIWLNPKLDFVKGNIIYPNQLFLWFGKKYNRKWIKIY